MKIKLHWILSGDIVGIYVVDYEGIDITLNNISEVVKAAKRKFKIPGKMYTVLADGKVFHTTKLGKEWKSYQLTEQVNEEH